MDSRTYPRARHSTARRLVTAMSGLALTLGLLPLLAGAIPGTSAPAARADDVTGSQDTMRTGWDQNEPNMGPSVVPTFVQRFSVTVGGQVYAQPVVVGSTVVVVTENDWAYGIDATTGAVNWQNHFGRAFVMSKAGNRKLRTCGDLVPNSGATGSPAYDPATGDVYFFAEVLNSHNKPKFNLYGIDPSNGSTVLSKRIWGHPANDSHISFNPQMQMERPGALLLNGTVYGAFASHCDRGPYTGYVAAINLASHGGTLWTDESGVSYNMAGIWQSGGGLMADPQGRIFVTSGNGVSPPKGPGSKPPGQLAESVIELANNSGKLSAQDFFSPADAPKLDAADTDFGSGGPVGLPFGLASGSGSQMLVQAGKDGRIFLLNRSSLGGREQGKNNTDNVLFYTKSYGGMWGHPAVFGDTTTISNATNGTANDFVFSVGKNDPMRVFRLAITPTGKPVLTNVGNSSLTYGYTSGSPVVTSDGTDPNSVVIWQVRASDGSGAGGELDAYALGGLVNGTTPSPCTSAHQCTLTPIWHAGLGTAAKFSIPATSNGWVYVGTRGSGTNGHVIGYSVPAPASAVNAATAMLPPTSVNATMTRQVSITARKTVTFTAVTANTGASNAPGRASQFTVGKVTTTTKGSRTAHPAAFPVTLRKGDQLHVQVTFAPAAPGAADGTLTLDTSTHHSRVVPLTGSGVESGLYPSPRSVAFPLAPDQGVTDVPVGIAVPQQVAVVNGGSAPETVRSVTPPSGPFTAASLPTPGEQIAPGQSLVIQVTFAPHRPGRATSSFTITGGDGRRVTVPLSGIGTASVSRVTASQAVIGFGSVPPGRTVTRYIHVTNTGNIPGQVSVPAPPRAPFHSRYRVPAGLPFNPGYDLLIPVTFTPVRAGRSSTSYRLVWRDRLGTHSLTVLLTGTGV
jgi:hypothetical protein